MASELVNTTIERYKENSKPSKETVNWKEIVHIVKMIEDLSSFISEEKVCHLCIKFNPKLQEIASTWLDEICRCEIVDGPLAKSLVKLYLLFTGGKSQNSNRDMVTSFMTFHDISDLPLQETCMFSMATQITMLRNRTTNSDTK